MIGFQTNHSRYLIIDNEIVYLLGCSIIAKENKASTIVPSEHEYMSLEMY